jgi:UDP-N-acetylmuramate dehydrogenase
LQGAEVLAGTRGTIGGWVAKNLGRNGSSPIESISEVDLLRDGVVTKWKDGNAALSESTINPQNDIVLAAAFRFTTGVKEEILRARREWLVKRNAIEPVNLANAGSIFKDHSGWKAADLIGKTGLKGRRHGRARISETNANFIVADVGSTASDILALIELMQRRVRMELNIRLELKVKLVGFDGQKMQKVA